MLPYILEDMHILKTHRLEYFCVIYLLHLNIL